MIFSIANININSRCIFIVWRLVLLRYYSYEWTEITVKFDVSHNGTVSKYNEFQRKTNGETDQIDIYVQAINQRGFYCTQKCIKQYLYRQSNIKSKHIKCICSVELIEVKRECSSSHHCKHINQNTETKMHSKDFVVTKSKRPNVSFFAMGDRWISASSLLPCVRILADQSFW